MTKPKPPHGVSTIGKTRDKNIDGKPGRCYVCNGKLKYQHPVDNNHVWKCLKCGIEITATDDGTCVVDPTRADMVDRITEMDRQYFLDHPTVKYYDRAIHPSEFPPGITFDYRLMVRVFQVVPGLRMRYHYDPKYQPPNEVDKVFPQAGEVRQAYAKTNDLSGLPS